MSRSRLIMGVPSRFTTWEEATLWTRMLIDISKAPAGRLQDPMVWLENTHRQAWLCFSLCQGLCLRSIDVIHVILGTFST